MLNTIKTNVLVPIMGRMGTATATWLMTTGIAERDYAHAVGAGVAAVGLIMADLLIGYLNRKSVR